MNESSSKPVQAEVLVEGTAGSGPALVLTAPISFWGGVDPKTGRIADVRHPQHGEVISGKVLFLPGTIGLRQDAVRRAVAVEKVRMLMITFSPMSMRPSIVAEPICGRARPCPWRA
jgi:hypothetical protein